MEEPCGLSSKELAVREKIRKDAYDQGAFDTVCLLVGIIVLALILSCCIKYLFSY